MKRAGTFLVPDQEEVQVEALAAGGWQLDRLDRALEFVTDWSLAVDGGAHVGSWTRAMAKRFDEVHAFEPAPDTFMCLQGNLAGLLNVRLHNLALGAEEGTAGLADDGRYALGNTGGRHLCGKGSIQIVPLDAMDLPSLGFLKLDVEGYELFALRGARGLLERHKPVVLIEDKIRMAHRYGLKPHAAAGFLESLGAREVATLGSDRVFAWGTP